MESPAVDASGIGVTRGGRVVLHDVGFTIAAGQVTGLLGPSGSGKTTLIRAIVGVQRHVTGELSVLGRPAGAPELRARVGYVTQSPSVYGDLTVRENLAYFARVLRAPDGEVDRVIDAVGLGSHEHQLVGRLSGGQVARVSLATALLGRPALLVLDEPTVGLDPVLRADLWDQFHRLADTGTTLVVSSHVMDEAERCDRILVLRDGGLLADDTPDGLRARTGENRLEQAFLALVRGAGA